MPALQPEGLVPAGYEETHAVIRSESHTVTIDQSGSGASGTFTVDVVGSASASDLAGGWGEGTYLEGEPLGTEYTETLVTSGGDSNSLSYHLVIGGTYANGTFTITSKTYTETSSYSRRQEVTRTTTVPSGAWYRESWDTEQSGSHTITWAAALDPQGVLVYTSYTQDSEDSAYWHTRTDNSYGDYHDEVYDTSSSGVIELSGAVGARTGDRSWSPLTAWWHPGPPVDEGSESDGESEPVADTVDLPSLEEPTQDWVWRAPADATGFTYHGVAVDSATITQLARYSSPDGSDLVYEVPDFELTSREFASDHRVYDQSGVAETRTGVEESHLDETYTWENQVTGSGSYLTGSADATFSATQTATFTVADEYSVLGSESNGMSEDGDPVDLVHNFTRTSDGSGTFTTIYDYHDAGPGLELTNATYTQSALTTVSDRSWGTANGVAFDTPSFSVESPSGSLSLLGTPGVVTDPDGLTGAVPLRLLTIPHQFQFTQFVAPPSRCR